MSEKGIFYQIFNYSGWPPECRCPPRMQVEIYVSSTHRSHLLGEISLLRFRLNTFSTTPYIDNIYICDNICSSNQMAKDVQKSFAWTLDIISLRMMVQYGLNIPRQNFQIWTELENFLGRYTDFFFIRINFIRITRLKIIKK